MAVIQTATNGLDFYQVPLLAQETGVAHGIFTRRGGVSSGPYVSLNLSFSVGDQPEYVRENRRRVQAALGLNRLVSVQQVHGLADVVVGAQPASEEAGLPEADILITAAVGIGLLIKQADCQAVLLYDPAQRVAANVHVGWRGQVANALGQAVARLRQVAGSRPESLLAVVGPGLGPCCAEFRNFREEWPEVYWRYQVRPAYFDLWGLSRDQLLAAGLRPEQISVAGLCTRCRPEDFFSYRRDGVTGRQGTVIALTGR
jgi:hypothetical protein